MARPIDEKIVAMKMDNSDFSRKAAETTTIFGKLQSALNKIPGVNLGKTAQDLNNISTQANNVPMGKLAENVQTVASRFSAMGIVAVTALQNIANRAVDAGIAVGKSLTLDQITAGFSEYELKMKSIGTVLSNTEWAGTTLTDVKRVLEELNVYADNTVYSFAQMTDNIGRFTAAGVTIDDSATAIKGLSNLAAASGSDVNQLNTAMYQMSQAMAAGTMNLMDWNSLVNAGMGGKKTQDALLATAKAMGVNVDMSEGFRNSISDGWLTSEIFLETLKKFGNDESMTKAATSVRTFTGLMDSLRESIGSGWATTFEHLFGDFEEATVLWTKVSEAITGWVGKTSDARNEMMKGIADGGGFQNIFAGIANAAKPIGQVFKTIGDAWRKVFPPATVDDILTLTERFKKFTEGLKLSDESLGKLSNIFVSIFTVIKTVGSAVLGLGKALLGLVPDGVGGMLLSLLEDVSKFGLVLADVIDKVSAFGQSIMDKLVNPIEWILDKLKILGNMIKEAFSGVGGAEILGAGGLVGIVAIVGSVFNFFMNAGGILDNIGETFEGLSDTLNNFAQGVKFVNLLLIAAAVGILAASLSTVADLNVEQLSTGLTSLAVALGIMMGGMMLMNKFDITGGTKAALTLIGLAVAVNLMAGALKSLSDLNVGEIGKGMLALSGIVAALSLSIIAMSKFGGKMATSSLQLIALAGAVYILAEAVDTMAKIDTGDLFKSLGALTIMLASLAVFLKAVDKTKFGIGSALGVVAVAGAIKLLVSAIDDIASIDHDEVTRGLTTIAIILAQIVVFSKLTQGGSMLAAGAGLVLIAAAINLLVPPIKALGSMSWTELVKGLGAMALALAAVAAAAYLMTGSIAGAAGLLVMAAGLNLLVIPIQKLGEMSLWELVKGFGGLAGGMLLVAAAAAILTPVVPSMLAFGAALLVMGVAVAAVGAGIALFGVGLTALATLTATSIAAIISSLALLLQGLTGLITGAVKFIVELGSALLDGLKELFPKVLETVVSLLMDLLRVIDENLPEFIDRGVSIVTSLMDGIAEHIGPLIDSGVKMIISLIDGMADAIEENGPTITASVLNLLGEILILVINAGVQMINALFGWIPGVKEATAEIGSTAEKYIRDNFGAEDVGKKKGDEFSKALNGKQAAAQKAGKGIANAGKTGADSVNMVPVGADFGAGFASGIGSKMSAVVNAAKNLASAASNKVKSWLQIKSPSRVAMEDGGWFGIGFAEGITGQVKTVSDSAKDLAVSAQESLNQFLGGFELEPEDNEIQFKAVVDYSGVDPSMLGSNVPFSVTPDTSVTRGLVSATRAETGQNGNNMPSTPVDNSVANHTNTYNINVEAKGLSSRSELRKLAEQIQTEMKNIEDRDRFSRGEGVAF